MLHVHAFDFICFSDVYRFAVFLGDVVVLNYVELDHEGTSYCQIMNGICLLISHSSLMSKACKLGTT